MTKLDKKLNKLKREGLAMQYKKVIYNYRLDVLGHREFLFNIPNHFEVLSIVNEYGGPCLYISVIPPEETVTKKFTLVRTGEIMDNDFCGANKYIGSFHLKDTLGGTTYHLFMEY